MFVCFGLGIENPRVGSSILSLGTDGPWFFRGFLLKGSVVMAENLGGCAASDASTTQVQQSVAVLARVSGQSVWRLPVLDGRVRGRSGGWSACPTSLCVPADEVEKNPLLVARDRHAGIVLSGPGVARMPAVRAVRSEEPCAWAAADFGSTYRVGRSEVHLASLRVSPAWAESPEPRVAAPDLSCQTRVSYLPVALAR